MNIKFGLVAFILLLTLTLSGCAGYYSGYGYYDQPYGHYGYPYGRFGYHYDSDDFHHRHHHDRDHW